MRQIGSAVVAVCWSLWLLGGGAAQAQEALQPILRGRPAPAQAKPLPQRLAEKAQSQLDREDEGDAPTQQLFLVVDTPYEIWSGAGSYVRVVAYRPDFRPAAGAQIYLDEQQVGITDAHGGLVFRNTFGGEHGGGEHVITGVQGARVGQVEFESYQRTQSFESTQIYAYTDRGVYAPGQTLRLRALAWRLRGDFSALAGEGVEVRLHGPQGLVGGARVQTDAWGVAALELPLPASLPEGQYTLSVQHESEVARTLLRVERFVPPVIRIQHDMPRYLARDVEEWVFSARLSSLQGGALGKGRLHLKVTHKGRVLWEETQVWDKPGQALQFEASDATLVALRQYVRDGERFRVSLKATDGTGRSDEIKRDILWTSSPYTVIFEADKDEYALGEKARVQIKVVDVDKAPVPNLAVTLRQEEPARRFQVKTDAFGVALFKVPLRQEDTCLDAYLKGVERALASECLYASPERQMISTIQTPLVQERRQVPIEVRLHGRYQPTEAVVHADVVDSSGALVHAFDLPLRKEARGYVARGHFQAPTWGTMLVTLFVAARQPRGASDRFGVGLLTEGQQLTVTPDKALKIELDGVPDQARPGQAIQASLRVRDGQGRPVDASLGAAVVDSAVISLLDPLEVTPMQRFYNPELKVLSTTGSKILTWPVVSRNWGQGRMDIALPPFGFLEPDWREGQVQARGGALMGGLGSAKGAGGGVSYGVGGMGTSGKKIVLEEIEIRGHSAAPAARPGQAPARSRRREAAAPQPRVVLRQRQPETSLWLDRVQVEQGRASLRFELPEAITEQQLSVIASDKQGGVGMLRKAIAVRQPLFVRADLPASLRQGEEATLQVAVRNLGDKPREVELSLRSQGLELLSSQGERVQVQPGQAAVASFQVKATGLGPVKVRVQASGDGQADAEERDLFLAPAGQPRLERQRVVLKEKAPLKAQVDFKPGEAVVMRVSVPGAGAAVEAFTRWDKEGWGFHEAVGTRAAALWYTLRFLQKQRRLDAGQERELRAAMAAEVWSIGATLRQRGGAVWWRSQRASPYLTSRALEGLVAAREADLLLEPELLSLAARVLLEQVDSEGLISHQDIAWWEGDSNARQEALTMDCFRVLAEAGPAATQGMPDAFDRLRKRALAVLRDSQDPLAMAHAALGLLAWEDNSPQSEEVWDKKRVVERLVQLRRQAHWEPSWFNAAGGELEASAAVLELLGRVTVEEDWAAVPYRETWHVLLGRRELMGTWRNGPGTVATLRALRRLPWSRSLVDSTVVVLVNGQEIKRQVLAAADPFLGALPLTWLDLSPHLEPGANQIEVRMEGGQEPVINLEHTRYGP